ncbi:MAG TPA: hypothetical protein VGI99_07345 [Gemmataceae bacterium]
MTQLDEKLAITAAGLQAMNVYGAARLEIIGRIATMEIADGNPVLIGQIRVRGFAVVAWHDGGGDCHYFAESQ